MELAHNRLGGNDGQQFGLVLVGMLGQHREHLVDLWIKPNVGAFLLGAHVVETALLQGRAGLADDSTFYDNGTTATDIGNTRFYSNGETRQRIGDTDFYSSGKTCQRIGSSSFCN